ncbi:agamous-like MADS-box protein AGL29 [Phragmites australis]|uniref:agamous-like MADS-box protein AGL29 n=1 Tax=Phragmites australis TaxID=29695 RepID=UPI002D79442C|nr:agamous-like MADS-box protein AGL29 [Phragmites australis]
MVKAKLTKGRQKIEIKPIQTMKARQVCFSKRRPSLFKHASELSTLCGGEVVVVIFSPGGKSFSFGHPSVCSVVDRFLTARTSHGHTMDGWNCGSHGLTGTSHEMNQQLAELQQSMEAEKQRKENVQEAIERESGGHVMQRFMSDVGILELHELLAFEKELTAVQGMLERKVHQVLQDAKKTRRPPPQSHMHMSLSSQVLFGDQRGRPMYTTLPSSSNGPHEVLQVNSLLHGSLGGIGNCFHVQFGG